MGLGAARRLLPHDDEGRFLVQMGYAVCTSEDVALIVISDRF